MCFVSGMQVHTLLQNDLILIYKVPGYISVQGQLLSACINEVETFAEICMELTVSLRTRKPCELEQDGMYTERLASQAQFLPHIVILKVSIINLKAKPVWLDAETHWPVGSEGFSRRQSGTQRAWGAPTVSFTSHKFFWVLSDKNVYWVVFLGLLFSVSTRQHR